MSSRSSACLSNIIPTTIVGAFASGDILQVLFFFVLFGISLALVGDKGKPVVSFLQDLVAPVFKLVAILMKAAPVGAFGAMAFTIGKYGIGSIANLAMLIGTFNHRAAVRAGGAGRRRALQRFLDPRADPLHQGGTAAGLGTSSSEAALPTLMDKMEREGCKRSVVGMVIPTGYSFNLDGTNIYMTLAALFIAQATDIPLSLGDQIALLLVAMLSSKGAAGITGAGFITLAATLSVVPAVPVAGMALILGIDRFMSECRALTNLVGSAVATIVVARWEGELDKQQLAAALERPSTTAPAPAELPADGLTDRDTHDARPAPGVVPLRAGDRRPFARARLGLESPLLPHLRRTREPAEAAAIPPRPTRPRPRQTSTAFASACSALTICLKPDQPQQDDCHARLPLENLHPRPQHGRRPCPVARHRDEGREDFKKPIIAIANSFTQFVPGHVHLKDMGQAGRPRDREGRRRGQGIQHHRGRRRHRHGS
ncbi:C4-dicarboxylate transport protein [Stutzerimonas stutzeri]